MIERTIQNELLNLSRSYPVVTITGPRQAGKTTLTKLTFPDYNYCNLENPEIRHLALTDPKALFKQFPCPVIFDEIQRVPDLLSYIQVMVDEKKVNGLFILTGSQQFALNQAITQSLAGRTALLYLLPLSIAELKNAGYTIDRDELLLKGFLPGIYQYNLNPIKAYRNYFQTYIERDVRQLVRVKSLTAFENFMRILAGRVGQVINLHSISDDLGISSTTLAEWLSLLEASFVIFRIYPYYENFGKRLIKSPKLYFSEIGVVSYLLGIESTNQVSRDPLLGGMFENMVVMEAIKSRFNQGLDHNLYFFRDNNKNEVDLLYQKHRKLIPIEIKSAMTYHDRLSKGIKYFQKISDRAGQGFLVYSGDLSIDNEFMQVIHFADCYRIFE